jgi:hypothetical protein
MPQQLENPFYYLENFDRVIDWVGTRYRHLLNDDELRFTRRVAALPQPSRALLVRMVMRKGPLFRSSKLSYEEIGCTRNAARALIEEGLIDGSPLLTLEQVFDLLTKPELGVAFSSMPGMKSMRSAKKSELLEALRNECSEARSFSAWHPASDDCVYQVLVNPLCDRLKLMFFGNCRQDWSEFVLSDLGIFKYETVELTSASLGFQSREDVDCYLRLHQLRERFDIDNEPDDILQHLPESQLDNPWLEGRRARLLFQIAQQFERIHKLEEALAVYSRCSYPGARIRAIRVLERSGRSEAAHALACEAEQSPESEAEIQQLMRIQPRLHRKLGLPKPAVRSGPDITLLDLVLPQPAGPYSVEVLVASHLACPDAPVFYVENTLMTSLFGLFFWKVLFAPVPGAFFHPFHTGPADLYSADFYRRREALFDTCMAELESDAYIATIHAHYKSKADLQSPFVVWPILSEGLIALALECIPAVHLKACFTRMLMDLRSNRAGFPDLIQFWPAKRRYRMIEVKAPNDKLQDNQVRWIEHFLAHGMPVNVCHVQWQNEEQELQEQDAPQEEEQEHQQGQGQPA